MMITPSSPSNSSDGISSSSSNTRTDQKDNNEFGKQIVELISRLINEADPESEKINIEFIITPFQRNITFASENPKRVSTCVSHTASDANRLRNLRRRQSSPSLSISSHDGIISISSASFSPHKTTSTSNEESEKFDELSYAYYQSLVQKERMQRQYLEEMPSKPQSPIMQKAAKKSKKKRRSKKNKKRESSSLNTSSQLEQSKMNAENKSVKKRSKKKHHRRRHESPDGEYNANWYIE